MPRQYATIVVNNRLRPAHQRVVLAHGIAHWELGHPDDRPKHELAADRYASLYLIDPNEFQTIARGCADAGAIADELGVTRRLLEAYLNRAS